MKISIIDVGSNSVRLATFADGKTLYKRLKTTRLGEGLAFMRSLKEEAISRTANAVCEFVASALKDGADRVEIFATAAVRSSDNGGEFVELVKKICGLKVEVLSGEKEALCGILGAVGAGDGGIIDVGGASTEVTVRFGGKIIYAQSVNTGTVRLHDVADRDKVKLLSEIHEKFTEFKPFDASAYNMYAIGGTASRLASVKHNLKEYKPELTDGTRFTVAELTSYADKLLTMPVEEIRATTICTSSADVVGGGCLLLTEVMKKFNIKEITVSEKDNLEGYLILKEGKS